MAFEFPSAEYDEVQREDPDLPATTEKDFYSTPRPTRSGISCISFTLLIFALWSSSIFAAIKVSSTVAFHECRSHKFTPPTEFEVESHSSKLTCGSSSNEAKTLGCVFDPLLASWLHPDCPSYGREEFAAFVKQENLSYHYEVDGRPTDKLIDMDKFPHMDGIMYWGTLMEHITHCAYTLKRIIYAQHENGRFDTVTGNFSHTDHCIELLIHGLKSKPVDLRNELYRTDTPITFLEC
jgi:hypothetical protein